MLAKRKGPTQGLAPMKRALTEASALGLYVRTLLLLRRTLVGLSIPHATSLLAIRGVLRLRNVPGEGRASEGEGQYQGER
jgi:hypothetical protein